MTKVFLGGTTPGGPDWRDILIPMLEIDYYNPVMTDWTPECQAEEIRQRQTCDLVLYVITPLMTGVYAIAEAVDDSNKRPNRTVFCVLREDGGKEFTPSQMESLRAVAKLIRDNGGFSFASLEDVAIHLNPVVPDCI